MHTIIVIPCLNEETTLASTCVSLGFGLGRDTTPAATTLVLVDNSSTDKTSAVMESVLQHSAPDSVILIEEAELGFVPARHRGALEARAFAETHHWPESDVLLVQADADTIYLDGYVEAMRNASIKAGCGVLVEADTQPPPDFGLQHAGYLALSDEIDRVVSRLNVCEVNEVVVDDKAVGFRLSDYFRWGGHRREFGPNRDEMYAETTRLFIRGKASHAQKQHVADAVARSSRRKLISDPALFFATAGFPREESWKAAWRRRYQGANTIEAFERKRYAAEIADAVAVRQAHHVVLFGLLPILVGNVSGELLADDRVRHALNPLLEFVDINGLSLEEPGHLLSGALGLIDAIPETIRSIIAQSTV